MNKETRTLLWLLGALYFAQGLSTGLIGTALYWWLLDANIGLTEDLWSDITFVALLPWGFKFVFGPLSDRFGKYRTSVIVTSIITSTTVILLIGVPTLKSLAVLLFIHSLMKAYGDVITDGWAIALVSKGERGAVQTVTRIGSNTGRFLGGSAMGLLSVYVSWEWCVALISLAMLVPAVIASLGKPKDPPKEVQTTFRETFRILGRMFADKRNLAAAAVALLAYVHAITMNLVIPWLKSLGFTRIEGMVFMGAGVFTYVLGAIWGNKLTNAWKDNRKVAFFLGTVVLSGAYVLAGDYMATVSIICPDRVFNLVIVAAIIGVADGIYAVTLGTIFMDVAKGITKTKAQTTVYAVFMALISLSLLTIFPKLGSYMWDDIHTPVAVMLGGVCQLLVLIPLWGVKLER